MNQLELAVVMPVYNEADSLAAVVSESLLTLTKCAVSFRLFVIDDGSSDVTPAVLVNLEKNYPDQLTILTQPNSGHGRACRAGYEAALQHGAKWILQIDSDGQCDPGFVPQFLNARSQANCIFGLRVHREDGPLRSIISTAARFLIAAVTGYDLRDANVPFRLIERTLLEDALRKLPPDFDLQNIALTLLLKRNPQSRWAYVPIRFRASSHPARLSVASIARKGFQMLTEIGKLDDRVSCGMRAI